MKWSVHVKDIRSLALITVVGLSYAVVATRDGWIEFDKLAERSLLSGILGVAIGLSLTLPMPEGQRVSTWPYAFLPMIYGLLLKFIYDALGCKSATPDKRK